MTITVADRSWLSAYLVLAGYCLACLAFVVFAPDHYAGHLPTSAALAELSPMPATVAFCIDAMWAVFPLALVAFCYFTPFKLRPGASASDIPVVLLSLLLFGLVATPALLYVGIFTEAFSLSTSSKIERLTLAALYGKPSLVLYGSLFFVCCIALTWLSYCLIPRLLFRLSRQKTT